MVPFSFHGMVAFRLVSVPKITNTHTGIGILRNEKIVHRQYIEINGISLYYTETKRFYREILYACKYGSIMLYTLSS